MKPSLRMRVLAGLLLAGVLAVLFAGCSVPQIPPEVGQADKLLQDLRGRSVDTVAPAEFKRFEDSLAASRKAFLEEKSKIRWLRDYEEASRLYKETLRLGDFAGKAADSKVKNEALAASVKEASLKARLAALRELATSLNEGQYATGTLMQAEVAVKEASLKAAEGRFKDANACFTRAGLLADKAQSVLAPIASRYADQGQIRLWQSHVNATVEESKRSGGYAIVVSKADRQLLLYKSGKLYKSFRAGLGTNGSHDKVRAGDRATPEGSYKITKKMPHSNYYKALLINYPNSEDLRRFAAYKRKGLIPKNAGIGGNIEIHGGGADGMTRGCVALDDRDMDALYSLVGAGTPVTIVGATGRNNSIASSMEGI